MGALLVPNLQTRPALVFWAGICKSGGAETWLEGKTASTSYWAVWRSTCMCKRPASRMSGTSDFIPITQKHN